MLLVTSKVLFSVSEYGEWYPLALLESCLGFCQEYRLWEGDKMEDYDRCELYRYECAECKRNNDGECQLADMECAEYGEDNE